MRFGDSELRRAGEAQPAAPEGPAVGRGPVLVYLGPGKDAKTAVFLVDERVEAQGDGVCKPSPRDCETLHMRAGDTEFLDVKDETGNVTAQYQLDLLEHQDEPDQERREAARPAPRCPRPAGASLRARHGAGGPLRYRYDAKSGTVRKIPSRAYKALLAKSARVALGTAGGF